MKWSHLLTTGVLLMITFQHCLVQGSNSSMAMTASANTESSSSTPTSLSIEVQSSVEASTSMEVSSTTEASSSIKVSLSVKGSSSVEQQSHVPLSSMPLSASPAASSSSMRSPSPSASISTSTMTTKHMSSSAIPHPQPSTSLIIRDMSSHTPVPGPGMASSMTTSSMTTKHMSSSAMPHPQPSTSLTIHGMSSHTAVPGPGMTSSMAMSAAKTSAMVHATSAETSPGLSATSSYIPQPPASQTPTGRPLTPVTTAKAKKFKFSFKITNMVCTASIRENDASNKEYQQLTQSITTAINNAYITDQFYRGAKVLYVYCGSVVPVIEITKSVNATSNSATELKLVEDVVKTGNFAGYAVNPSSFSSTPSTAPIPTIYITMKTDLSIKQFCASKTDFKTSFTTFLVATSGLEMIKAAQIVVFDNGCMQTSTNYNKAQPMFYVSASATDASSPDTELTIRAFKLLRQFLLDGTTWRLSASFDKKVKSVEMGGRDKLVETEYSEMTIVLIGMGTTLGLLLLIIIIVLVATRGNRKHDADKFEAVTIENDAYRQESQRRSQPHINGGYDNEIVIDEHNYEYPLAPTPNGRFESNRDNHSTVVANKGVYQELQNEPQKDEAPPQYQTLSAEEEAITNKVAVEPEDPAAYTEIIVTFEAEPEQLTPSELAQRNDDDDRLKKEFQSLEYDMPKGDEYPPEVTEKNRLLNVLPRPETRVILSSIPDQPHSDYINANLIKDMHGKKQFILTQGPLQNTVDDFWRMISEQNVHVVVMVTPLVQFGTEKCFQYWPADSIARNYGEIEVQLNKKELKPDFTVTSMTMKSKQGEREVVLYRYMTWPEDNIPEKSRSFVAFLLETKKSNEAKENGTMLVHCSDGVSMSAVSVAIATGIQSLQENKSVDVYSIVKGLRKERAGAVQVFGQYKFIYQALYEYAVHLASGDDTFANQADVTSSM